MTRTPFRLEKAPNGPLAGDVYLPENPRGVPVVVGVHGFKGFKDWGFWPDTGRQLAEAGIALVTFNVSGSGIGDDPERFTEIEAFETNTVAKELADLGAVLDAVVHREIALGSADVRRLGLLGHSRGGGVALVRAGRDPRVNSVVTWAAISTFERYDATQRAYWLERGYAEIENARTGQTFRLRVDFLEDLERHGEAYDPRQAAGRLTAPLLLLHGTRDETVPAEEAQTLARHADPGLCQLRLIEGTGHTFGAVHPYQGPTEELERAWGHTSGWFHETLGVPAQP